MYQLGWIDKPSLTYLGKYGVYQIDVCSNDLSGVKKWNIVQF